MNRYRIVIACVGVPANKGEQAAIDIAEDFKNRPWHTNVFCRWNGQELILKAENDYDENGMALQDEFSDEICACIKDGFDGNLKIISVEKHT